MPFVQVRFFFFSEGHQTHQRQPTILKARQKSKHSSLLAKIIIFIKMVKFSLWFVLALSAATSTYAYLASLEKGKAAAKASSGDGPSNYYFASGKSDSPLPSASSGIKTYLDALVTSPASSTISGSGMTSYLDALPKNSAGGSSGSSMSSYAASLNQAGATAPPPAFVAEKVAESSSFQESGNAPASTTTYLSALASSSSSVSGAGIRGYLDGLPSSDTSAPRGAGITTYLDALPSSTSFRGAGIQTYTDALSPCRGLAKVADSAKGFAIGSVSGTFQFSIDANEAMIQQIASGMGRKAVLKGIVDSVSERPPSGETPYGISTFSLDADTEMFQKIADEAKGRKVAMRAFVDNVSYEPSTRGPAPSVEAEVVEAAAAPEEIVAVAVSGNYLDSLSAPPEIVAVAVSGNYLDSLSAPPEAVAAPIQEVAPAVTPVEASRRGKLFVSPTQTGLTFQWAWSNSWSSRNEL
jgi:hypothetical protein